MCGIAGFIGPEGSDSQVILEDMLSAIAYRGPDDSGTWVQDNVAIGHLRLSIIDLSSRAHQPYVSDDGRGVLSYNGEIYNYPELREELEGEGVEFISQSDTEVMLNALHHWGPERAVSKFNGMFAFAYYDLRSKTLWLARDRLGIKPLYVYRSGDLTAFASEPKALFAHPDIGCAADPHSLITLVVHDRFEGEETPYMNVRSIEQGQLVKIRSGLEVTTSYFSVIQNIDPQRILGGKKVAFADQVDELGRLLRESVRMHLISDAPVATMCSGGLDSSLVSCFAKEIKPDVVSYVADIEGMNGEEARRASLVCTAHDIELRTVEVNAETFLRLLPIAIQTNDQPLYFPQDVAELAVAERMHEDGFKVVLTGHGADELFGGYGRYGREFNKWRRRRMHSKLVPDNPLFKLLGKLHPLLKPINLAQLAADPFAPATGWSSRISDQKSLLIDGARRHIRQVRLFEKLESLPRYEDRAFITASLDDLYIHLKECLTTTDKMTMRYSIESRVPFLENAVIDFALHLPVRAKFHNGETKCVVKALADKILPAELIRLEKIGFDLPASMWFGTETLLKDGVLAEQLKWNKKNQAEMFALFQRNRIFQFRLLSMELWLRMRFHRESAESLTTLLGSLRK